MVVVADYAYLFVVLRRWPDENDLRFRRRERASRRGARPRRPTVVGLLAANTAVLLTGVLALI